MQLVARTSDLHVEQVGDETVVFDHRTQTAHALNAAAAFVWERCDGTHTLAQMTAAARQSGLPEGAVEQALDLLQERELLVSRASRTDGRQFTRRMLTKTAIAAMVPAIVSIASPASALVLSGFRGNDGPID